MPIILHVDFNSYFATVEQQKNPYLRGKPVGVLKAEGRGVIIAASVEAKHYGVRTGMLVYEAKRLAPHIVLVPADFDSYYDTTKRFVEIARRYSDCVELFSLDEVFLDATQTVSLFGGFLPLALQLKKNIREELGEWLTVSIGIAKNKMLAKFASDIQKPDGLVEITDENQDDYLGKATFEQICGIGMRLERHLRQVGITQLLQIRSIPEDFLRASFGPYWAPYLKRLAWGRDDSPVVPTEDFPLPKSVSRTYTLYREITDHNHIFATIRNLVEEATEKLRLGKMAGRQFGLMVRNNEESDALFVTRKNYTNDSCEVFRELKKLYEQRKWYGAVRFLGVWISLLSEEQHLTDCLLPSVQKRRLVLAAQDCINNRFGHYTLFPASLLRTHIIHPEVNGYLGDERMKQHINNIT